MSWLYRCGHVPRWPEKSASDSCSSHRASENFVTPGENTIPGTVSVPAQHFVQRFAEKIGKSIAGLTSDALRLCLAYKWPGNIRELENIMERAVTLAPEGKKWITPDLLPNNLRSTTESAPSLDLAELVDHVDWSALLKTLETRGSLTGLLNYLEWTITRRAVAEYGGNKSRAAKVLGRTYRWLRKLESEMTNGKPPTPRSAPDS